MSNHNNDYNINQVKELYNKGKGLNISFIGDSITYGGVAEADFTKNPELWGCKINLDRNSTSDLDANTKCLVRRGVKVLYDNGGSYQGWQFNSNIPTLFGMYTGIKTGIRNRGRSGWTSKDLLNNMTSLRYNEDLVYIMCGRNDFNKGVIGYEYYKNLRSLVEKYLSYNTCGVILVRPPKTQSDDEAYNIYSGYTQAVADDLNIKCLDVNKFTRENLTAEDYMNESHPNNYGYEKIAKFIADDFKNLLEDK